MRRLKAMPTMLPRRTTIVVPPHINRIATEQQFLCRPMLRRRRGQGRVLQSFGDVRERARKARGEGMGEDVSVEADNEGEFDIVGS